MGVALGAAEGGDEGAVVGIEVAFLMEGRFSRGACGNGPQRWSSRRTGSRRLKMEKGLKSWDA